MDYEKCKCEKHPATHENDFLMKIDEFAHMNKIIFTEIEATCKVCGETFYFTNKKNDKSFENT